MRTELIKLKTELRCTTEERGILKIAIALGKQSNLVQLQKHLDQHIPPLGDTLQVISSSQRTNYGGAV